MALPSWKSRFCAYCGILPQTSPGAERCDLPHKYRLRLIGVGRNPRTLAVGSAMRKMSRILFAACAVLSAPIAWAQEGILFPDGKADTILVCEREGSPVPECTVGCAISWSGQAGTTPPPQQGSGFNIQNAQRVELYGNGVRRQSFPESRGGFITEALVRFPLKFRRPRLGAATGVFG